MNTGYKKREFCAICSNRGLRPILNYGRVPLAGDFPKAEELKKTQKFDLNILFCEQCGLVQTDSVISADALFKDYRYMSSVGLSGHFKALARTLKSDFKLDSQSRILEIGSNDGVLLKPLNDVGLTAWGIEPAVNIAAVARKAGCSVINDYFSYESAHKHNLVNSFDLVVSCNCFAHIDNIHSMVKGIKAVLKPGKHFVLEVHYVKDLIDGLQYDNIYHEHVYYYSLNSLNYLFSLHGMSIVNYEEIPIHSGSIRVCVKNSPGVIEDKVVKKLEEERKSGLCDFNYYRNFSKSVVEHIKGLKAHIGNLVKSGAKVVGYGASGRANMLCNLCEFSTKTVSYIIDESPERVGRFITGTDIPVVDKEKLYSEPPTHVLVFAWNYSKMIMEKLKGRGFQFIVPLPTIQTVRTADELKKYAGI